MEIRFYSDFGKKKNSTKIPAVTDIPEVITGDLKAPCDIINPVVRLSRRPLDAVPEYCYAYIPVFNRYYFVSNIGWSGGFWEISMEVDVLGSWRTDIGNSEHYILRTNNDTDIFNPYITDTLYPAMNEFTTQDDSLSSDPFKTAFSQGIAGGTFVVGIISGVTDDAVGAITYYALTPYQFGQLKSTLFSDNNLTTMGITNLSGVTPEVLKTMYNPYQYIASCMWFPFYDSDIPGKTAVTKINIGWWEYTLSGYRIQAQVVNFYQTQQLPDHPQVEDRGIYMNYSPYTRRTLIGRFGDIPIDTSYFSETNNRLALAYDVDLINGQCKLHIGFSTSGPLAHAEYFTTREFLLGVPIQLAQIGVDYLGVAVTAVDAAANVAGNAMSLNVTGTVSAAAHGIHDTIKSSMPQLETGGSNGSFVGAYTESHLISHFYTVVDEDIEHKGRPVCSIMAIKNLSGFVLCSDGEFDISCLDTERTMITEYLTSGIFWE